MKIIPDDRDEALSIMLDVMPEGVSARIGASVVTHTSDGYITYIPGAAKNAEEMGHVKPHADQMVYQTGSEAAQAVTFGWHIAYGRILPGRAG